MIPKTLCFAPFLVNNILKKDEPVFIIIIILIPNPESCLLAVTHTGIPPGALEPHDLLCDASITLSHYI